jgi:hypothetical protein
MAEPRQVYGGRWPSGSDALLQLGYRRLAFTFCDNLCLVVEPQSHSGIDARGDLQSRRNIRGEINFAYTV